MILAEAETSIGQVISYVFFLGISTAVGWIVRTLPAIRDDMRAVKREVMGLDGKNGLISRVADHEARIDAVENRHDGLDAVAKHEREMAHSERRQTVRRESDKDRGGMNQ